MVTRTSVVCPYHFVKNQCGSTDLDFCLPAIELRSRLGPKQRPSVAPGLPNQVGFVLYLQLQIPDVAFRQGERPGHAAGHALLVQLLLHVILKPAQAAMRNKGATVINGDLKGHVFLLLG
jgi:hypothetical protein